MMKRSFVVALLATALISSCKPAPSEVTEVTYKTMAVQTGSCELKSNYPARLNGQQFVEIRPQVSGTITNILISEGHSVKKGELMFIIDQAPYKSAKKTALANVESAKAALATAQLTVKSKEELYKNNVVSDYDLQTAKNSLLAAKAALSQAEATLAVANNNLSYTEVRSPVNGVASMIPYRIGALVSSTITDPLVSVADDSKMYAYFSMTQNQIVDLITQYGSLKEVMTQMSEVNLLLSTGKEYAEVGYIDAISGTVDDATGAVAIRATFENPQQLLRNGANATISISKEVKDVVIIPKAATFELQNKVLVYKIIDGRSKSFEIKCFDAGNGKEYVVESGLTAGEMIIADGAGLMREGTVVFPEKLTEEPNK